MSDVSELITLGIGTPSDIAHLTLFGLSPNNAPPPADLAYIYIDNEAIAWPTVSAEALAQPSMTSEAIARPTISAEAIATPSVTGETVAWPSISGEVFHVHQ